MFCPNCGNEINSVNAKFCQKCGYKFLNNQNVNLNYNPEVEADSSGKNLIPEKLC